VLEGQEEVLRVAERDARGHCVCVCVWIGFCCLCGWIR
jgi:hypothetical protein